MPYKSFAAINLESCPTRNTGFNFLPAMRANSACVTNIFYILVHRKANVLSEVVNVITRDTSDAFIDQKRKGIVQN